MRRTPLRPLAHVISAREARERAKRNQAAQVKTRVRAENRLLILGLAFVLGFGAVGGKMAILASSKAEEPAEYTAASQIVNQRADIIDRNGNVLATNMSTQALYAQPHLMVDPKKAASY